MTTHTAVISTVATGFPASRFTITVHLLFHYRVYFQEAFHAQTQLLHAVKKDYNSLTFSLLPSSIILPELHVQDTCMSADN